MNRKNLVSQCDQLDFIKEHIKEGYVLDQDELNHIEEYKRKFGVVTPRQYPLKDLTVYLKNHRKEKGNLLISLEEFEQIKKGIQNDQNIQSYYIKIKKEADFWMSLSDDQLYDMIPHQYPGTYTPGQYEGCPIHGGNYETFQAFVEHPGKWQCKKGGEWWYDGAEVENPGTHEKVRVVDNGYGWKAPLGFAGAGKRFYFTAAYRRFMMKQLFWSSNGYRQQPACMVLAFMYRITRDKAYARKAFLMLNRLAEVYEDLNGNWHPHRTNGGSHLDDYVYENYYCKNILMAYDMVFDALPEMGDLADFFDVKKVKGKRYPSFYSIQENIEQGMIFAMLDFAQNTTLGQQMLMLTRGIVLFAGVVLDNREIVEYCIRGENGIQELFINGMHIEGKYCEDTFGYMVVPTNLSLELLVCKQYFEKNRLDVDLSPAMQHLLLRAQINCSGNTPLFGDTHPLPKRADVNETGWSYIDEAGFLLSPQNRPILAGKRAVLQEAAIHTLLDSTVNTMNPMYDFKMLAAFCQLSQEEQGKGTLEVQADSVVYPDGGFGILRSNEPFISQKHLVFYFAYTNGHRHNDKLGINLFAFGHSLVTDTGYPANNYNAAKRFDWDAHAASHSVTVVDQKDQKASYGSLLHYLNHKDFNMIEASQEAAYDIPVYRRALFTGHGQKGEWYVLDIFRVKGGTMHDYKWSGPRGNDEDVRVMGNEDLHWDVQSKGTLAGEDVSFGSKPGYGWLKDVKRTTVMGHLEAIFETGDENDSGLRILYPKSQAGEFIKAKGEARGLFMHSELDPFLIKRNRFTHEEDNTSVFISLLEPFQGKGKVISIVDVPCETPSTDHFSYAVKIHMEQCTHFYCGSLSDEVNVYQVEGHRIKVCARHLFLEEVSGILTKGYVVSAKLLSIDDKNISLNEDVRAKVKKVDLINGWIDLEAESGMLSEEDKGAIVLAETGTIRRNGIQIKRVEPQKEGVYRIYSEYTNLSVGTLVVKEVIDPYHILTVSEFGKTYSFVDFYDNRPVHTDEGEVNLIKKRNKMDPSLYRIEFAQPFARPLSPGDRLYVPVMGEGAQVVVHKATVVNFEYKE